MYSNRSTPINRNFSYHQHISRTNTLVPPGFSVHHHANSNANSNAQLLPPINPGEQMYPVHHNPNYHLWVQQSSVTYTGPLFHHQTSEMNTVVPLQQSLGQHQNANSYGQLHHGINPAGYQMTNQVEDQVIGGHQGQLTTAVNSAGYQKQQIQQGYSFQQNPVTNSAPFYYEGLGYPSNYIQQQVMNNPVYEPAAHAPPQQQVIINPAYQPAAQDPPQQVQPERNAGEEVLVVHPEQSLFPFTRPRLRWTNELQRRFARAVEELGGCFKATPKNILKRMNVRGLTRDQLKSHLQKYRNKFSHMNQSAEQNMGHGHQDNTTTGATQLPEGIEAYLDFTPILESPIGEHESLLRSSETANNSQNHRVVGVDHPPSSLVFEDFDLPDNSRTQNENADVGIALDQDPPCNFKFTDFDFPLAITK